MNLIIFTFQSGRGGAWRDAMMDADDTSSGVKTVVTIIFIIFVILLYTGKNDADN